MRQLRFNDAVLLYAGVSGCLAVVAAALAAHGPISASGAIESWRSANQMHLFHVLALLGLASFREQSTHIWVRRSLFVAAIMNILGVLLFCGILYWRVWSRIYGGLVLVPASWVPIGGGCFLLSWLAVAVAGVFGWGATSENSELPG